MYVYFDANGTLKEIITEKPFRVGDSKRDKIYVYWDGEHSPVSGWVKYRKPSGQEYPSSAEQCFFQIGDELVGKSLPEKPLRNLKYFSYDHTYEEDGVQKIGYKFYEITIPDEVLSSSSDDEKVPTENDMVISRIRFVLDDGYAEGQVDEGDSIITMGALVFSVETNIGILTDSSINESQYNYLISLLSTKMGVNTHSVKVNSLPSTGNANTIYYVKNANDSSIYDAYYWNGSAFVYMGTTSYGLFTEEEGNAFKVYVLSLFDAYKQEMTPYIQAAASGSPKGVYATVAALTSANPNHNYIYLVTEDGKWYYWGEGSTWTAGGTYLANLPDAYFDVNSTNAIQNSVVSTFNRVFEAKKRIVASNNLIDGVNDIIYGKYIQPGTGNEVADGNYICTDFIPIRVPGGTYSCTGMNMIFYDIAKNRISNTSSSPFTVPANCFYIRTYTTKANQQSLKLYYGTTAPTDKYFIYEQGKKVDEVALYDQLVNDLNIISGGRVVKSSNILDPTTFVRNEYVNASGTVPSNGFMRTDYVRVKPATQYIKSFAYGVVFYDKDKVALSSETIAANTVFITPINCVYIRAYNYTVDESTMKMAEGTTTPTDDYFSYISGQSIDEKQFQKQVAEYVGLQTLVKPEDWITGGYYNASAVLNDTNNFSWSHTDFIEVQENTLYYTNCTKVINFFDKNKTLLSSLSNDESRTYFVTPANAKYIKMSTYYTSYMDFVYLYKNIMPEHPLDDYYVYQKKEDVPPIYHISGAKDEVYLRTLFGDDNLAYEYGVYARRTYVFELNNYGQARINESLTSDDTIYAYAKQNGEKRYGGEISVKVIAQNAGSGTTKKVMFIGDSTTDNDYFVPSVLEKFADDGMSITCIGGRGTAPAKHMGVSGAKITYFYNNSASPFYDSTDQKFNFQTGLTRYSLQTPEIVIINLGINDIWADFLTDEVYESTMSAKLSQLDYIISSIHSVNPNIIIGVALPIPPTRDLYGWTKSYQNFPPYFVYKKAWKYFNKKLFEHINTDAMRNANIYPIAYNLILDDIYAFPKTQRKPFEDASYEIEVSSNGVHPGPDGYKQMARQAFAFLKWTTTL